MVLDPISAAGLASNVLSFIDFGIKVLAKTKEIHESYDGSLLEHREIRLAAERCGRLRHSIDDSLSLLPVTESLTPAEIVLQDVAKECQDMAKEFCATLDGLAARSGQSRWKTFRQAIKAVWDKNGIEFMRLRLGEQREILIVHLLVVVG